MIQLPTIATHTYTLFPYTKLFRSANPRYVYTNYCSSDVICLRRLWYCLFSQEKKEHSAGECTIGLRRLCRVAETPETFTLSQPLEREGLPMFNLEAK